MPDYTRKRDSKALAKGARSIATITANPRPASHFRQQIGLLNRFPRKLKTFSDCSDEESDENYYNDF